MKRYDIYYTTKDNRIEKKNVSQDEMQSFLDSLHRKEDHLLRISQVKVRDRDEEERWVFLRGIIVGWWWKFLIPRRLTIGPERIYRWLNFYWRLKDEED